MGHGDFPDTAGAPRIWVHAASVGEIQAIRPVANGLLEHYPGAVMAVTAMTTAGREAAERRIPGAAAWMLAPLDKPRAVRSFLERVQPSIVLITETEIWPNYFIESALMGATVAVVNGRMSERSLRRYFRVRGLFEDALHQATLILAQSRKAVKTRGDTPSSNPRQSDCNRQHQNRSDAGRDRERRTKSSRAAGFCAGSENIYRRIDGTWRRRRDRGRLP
jgi:hypothetical protein